MRLIGCPLANQSHLLALHQRDGLITTACWHLPYPWRIIPMVIAELSGLLIMPEADGEAGRAGCVAVFD
ncbi:hypothetical protein [Aquitalea aquatilis]|uniref:hypothetical protein n=1 Tax=Aquitalea aquatilis TaxID=1537400 RepID=UPI0010BDB04E|nr:hypothetical protein [Aquitalea aquatilis]